MAEKSQKPEIVVHQYPFTDEELAKLNALKYAESPFEIEGTEYGVLKAKQQAGYNALLVFKGRSQIVYTLFYDTSTGELKLPDPEGGSIKLSLVKEFVSKLPEPPSLSPKIQKVQRGAWDKIKTWFNGG